MTCRAKQYSDQMSCECGNVWDINDGKPPKCNTDGLIAAVQEENAALLSRMHIMTQQQGKFREQTLHEIGNLCDALGLYISPELIQEVRKCDSIEFVELPEIIDYDAALELDTAADELIKEMDSLERTHGTFRGHLRVTIDRVRAAIGISE